jgi:hypothetical protein
MTPISLKSPFESVLLLLLCTFLFQPTTRFLLGPVKPAAQLSCNWPEKKQNMRSHLLHSLSRIFLYRRMGGRQHSYALLRFDIDVRMRSNSQRMTRPNWYYQGRKHKRLNTSNSYRYEINDNKCIHSFYSMCPFASVSGKLWYMTYSVVGRSVVYFLFWIRNVLTLK